MTLHKTVLVVGASRGLGLALAEEYGNRGWRVIATVRGPSPALEALKSRFSGLEIETADIADLASVRALHRRLAGRRIDTLFVNAGICRANELTPLSVAESDFLDMMLTNALAPMRVVELFHGQVAAGGVIAVMSSEIGSIANNGGFWELYSSSKAALNMLMKCFSARHPRDPRALLLVAPGWVRTDMGGDGAALEIPDSIPLVVDMVERRAGVPGLRYADRFGDTIAW